MSNAARLLDTLTAAGVELIPEPPNIRVRHIQRLPPGGAELIRAHKPELLQILTERRWHGFTLAELEREAGEDWPEIRHRPEALIQFALALREEREVQAGIRPKHWTETATCARCGPVHVPPFLAGQRMVGCRWCAPRLAGVAIPRPAPAPPPLPAIPTPPRLVRCSDCTRFERLPWHPHLGHCQAGEPEAPCGLWDTDRRACARRPLAES